MTRATDRGLARRNVLVIEDDKSVLECITDLLSEHGINAIGVPAADLALDRLRRFPFPDCIVLDWLLPRMTGRDFVDTLEREPSWSKIPVVIISAAVENVDAPGALAVLQKPFENTAIISAVRRSFGLSAQARWSRTQPLIR